MQSSLLAQLQDPASALRQGVVTKALDPTFPCPIQMQEGLKDQAAPYDSPLHTIAAPRSPIADSVSPSQSIPRTPQSGETRTRSPSRIRDSLQKGESVLKKGEELLERVAILFEKSRSASPGCSRSPMSSPGSFRQGSPPRATSPQATRALSVSSPVRTTGASHCIEDRRAPSSAQQPSPDNRLPSPVSPIRPSSYRTGSPHRSPRKKSSPSSPKQEQERKLLEDGQRLLLQGERLLQTHKSLKVSASPSP